MKTTTRKTVLHKDQFCKIHQDSKGVLHVLMGGIDFVPAPSLYPDFKARDFADLYAELFMSGIPESLAARWVNQAQGFDV